MIDGRRGRSGFTLIEVLAAVMLIAIVLPAIMEGISLATTAASTARRRTDAAALAQSQLNTLLSSQQWQSGQMAGTFAPDWPDYQWQATVVNWPGDTTGLGIQEIDMEVFWTARSQRQSVIVSTLTYSRTSSSSSSSSSP
jgi:general secretion pathway protein I